MTFAPLWEAPALLLVVAPLTRLVGLRSFSKMSAYDCAITIVFGSTLAAVLPSPDRGLGQGLTGKLRERGVARLADIRATVFETMEDVSVIAGETPVEEALLRGVRGDG